MKPLSNRVWGHCEIEFGALHGLLAVSISFPRVERHVGVPAGLVRRILTPFRDRQQIGQGDWLIAVRAEPARPDAAAEDAAIRTPLLSQVAGFTRRAQVDRLRWRGVRWDGWQRGGMASSPQGLAACGRADALAAHRREGVRAYRAGDRLANVTPRVLSHAVLPPRTQHPARAGDSSGQ